jgi:hypothetical protein
VLDAAVQSQANTSQPDIAHCTAHYLRSALPKPFEVKISPLKIGRGFSNLTAELWQDGGVRITTHLIFTSLPEAPGPQLPTPRSLTVTRPSPHARQIPIEAPPSQAKATKLVGKFSFKEKMQWSEQWDQLNRRNIARASNGTGGAEWACWIQLKDESDGITQASLPFFGDMFRNFPELLPKDQKAGPSWFPTMVLAIEFKTKIPKSYNLRTVGLWAEGRHLHEGRHDNTVEVWTSPCEFGDENAKLAKDWRKEQHCLCVSTQMALTLPLEVNTSRGAKL